MKIPLIIYWPKQIAKEWNQPTSHYDIVPYLMKNNFQCKNEIENYSVGKPLFDASNRPYLLVGSYVNMGILWGKRNITLSTTGSINVSDNESNLVADAVPEGVVTSVLQEMRKYYAK